MSYKPTYQKRGAKQYTGKYQKQKAAARRRRQQSARQPVYSYPVEKKGMDTVIGTSITTVLSSTSTNGDVLPMNLIRAGTGSYNRVGRKSHAISLRINGIASCYMNTQATTGDLRSNTLRQVVVWDKQPTGVLPTFDSIFGHTVQDGTESTGFLDPLKYDNMDRFQILRDKKITCNPMLHNNQSGSDDGTYYHYDLDDYIKLGSRESVYSGNSTPMTISDISSGALYVIYRAYLNEATYSQWTIDDITYARLRYND